MLLRSLSPLSPRYRFPISPILPPRPFPPFDMYVYTYARVRARVCARIEPTRIPRCLFLSTRTPVYDVPSLGHGYDLSPSSSSSFSPFHSDSDGETRAKTRVPLLFPVRRSIRPRAHLAPRDKISRITAKERFGNYPTGDRKEDSTIRFEANERSYILFRTCNLQKGINKLFGSLYR